MNAGDIVWVPFPHVDTDRTQSRPTVVLAGGLGAFDLFWAVMITSASNSAWPGDIVIADHEGAGLPIPSRIRTAKLATLAPATAVWIGRVDDRGWAKVRRTIARSIGTTMIE